MSFAAAGGKRDEAHRPRRIGLRPCDPRYRRQRGSARCQMQKFSAGKFHIDPFLHFGRRSASRNHPGLMLPARMTLAHLLVSVAM